MNRHHLELFKFVAEKKSFSKASEILHISQPAISQQINVLEDYLAVKLFNRTTRKVSLTEEGKLLYKYAIQIYNLFLEAEESINEFRKIVKGTLTVGASLTIGEYMLPRIIGQYKKLNPQVQIKAEVFNTQQIVKHVLDETIELGLIEGSVEHDSLSVFPFIDDELGVIVSPNHPLSGQRSVSTEQLTYFPLIFREKGSGTRLVIESALKEAGLSLKSLPITLELASNEAVKAAVEADLGISILSSRAVQKELQLNILKLIPIADLKISRKFSAVINVKHKPTSAMENFLAFLQAGKKNIS